MDFKKMKKEFKEVDPGEQKVEAIKNLSRGKIKIKTKSGFKVEASINPSIDLKKSIEQIKPVMGSCKFKLKMDQNLKKYDVNIKTEVDGKVKENKLDKLNFEFKLDKTYKNQNVNVFVEFEGDALTFSSPAGEKDFDCKFGATIKI